LRCNRVDIKGRSGVKRWGKSPPAEIAISLAGRACNWKQGEWVVLRWWRHALGAISSQWGGRGQATPGKLHTTSRSNAAETDDGSEQNRGYRIHLEICQRAFVGL
jgi:hypothetical protein